MAGQRIILGGHVCFIDYPDGHGETVIDGQKIRWEFHEYTGPGFFKITPFTDENELFESEDYFSPDEDHPVWKVFEDWLNEYRKSHPHPNIKRGLKPIKLDIGGDAEHA